MFIPLLQTKLATTVKKVPTDPKITIDEPILENLNRLQIDGEEARTVDEALIVLGYIYFIHYITNTFYYSFLFYRII